MAWSIPTLWIHQSPLLIILILPLLSLFFGWRRVHLKSAVHFQQGTISSAPWRIAVMMTILSIPPFTLWCLLMRSRPSGLFYLLGSLLAIPVSLFSVTPILHYIPSPSVTAFIQHRYLSSKLRFWIATTQGNISYVAALFLLMHTSNMLATVSTISFYIVCPVISLCSLLSIISNGHSSIMSPVLILNILCILTGVGIFLYFGIEDVTSFGSIFPIDFSLSQCVISFFVGHLMSLYQLSSSVLYYQTYFPLSTIYKLRISMIFHAAFQLLAFIFAFILISLFHTFMEKHCNLSYSFIALFQFTRTTVPHRTEFYAVIGAFALFFLLVFQWIIFSTSTHIWEEFLKAKLRLSSPGSQLKTIQFLLVLTTTFLAFFAVTIRYLKIPLHMVTPSGLFILQTGVAILAGIYLCGYFFPCCNRNGGLASFAINMLVAIGLFALFFTHNELPYPENSCGNDVQNVTMTKRPLNLERFFLLVVGISPSVYSILFFVTTLMFCLLISILTGGQDQMTLDWNLVVYPCTSLMKGRSSSYGKRPVIESESFRFAQQMNSPPTHVYD